MFNFYGALLWKSACLLRVSPELYFLALLFIMYDPPEIHSQCVDVSSSPCYVNVSDIPYEILKGTAYDDRDKEFYESIRDESIYVDTCDHDWKKYIQILYKYLYFDIEKVCFIDSLKDNDIVNIDGIKDEISLLKEIFRNFESKFCPFTLQVVYAGESFHYVKMILDKHATRENLYEYWFHQRDTINYSFWFNGGLRIHNIVDVYDTKNPENIILICKNNNLEIKNDFYVFEEEITIYDFLGLKQIESTIKSNLTNIDISSLSRGIYFVRIKNKIYKFMKE